MSASRGRGIRELELDFGLAPRIHQQAPAGPDRPRPPALPANRKQTSGNLLKADTLIPVSR